MPLGALVVHGVGRQGAGFSDGLRTAVSACLGAEARRVVWQEALWAPILEPRETALWDAMHRATDPTGASIPLDFTALRRFILHNVGDATAYQRDTHIESAGQLIHQRVSNAIEALQSRLADSSAPIVVLAHSLGGHILSNYIWDRQHPSGRTPPGQPLAPVPMLAGLITFGCNIPLFALAYREARPIDLPGEAVTEPALADAVRWLNFLDRDDVLGWPLRPLYGRHLDALTPAQRRTVEKIEDHEINAGGAVTNWNPLSHDAYWDDPDVAERVAGYLRSVIATVKKP